VSAASNVGFGRGLIAPASEAIAGASAADPRSAKIPSRPIPKCNGVPIVVLNIPNR
jgi:hypothetical protein